MKGRICLCPASIKWIHDHLMKSARAKFNGLLARNVTERIVRRRKRKGSFGSKNKRQFSRKQLAAQRLFSKRAKAGTLRRRKRRR